jgi:hypothetical protein
MILGYMGYCFPNFLLFEFLMQTFATGSVLVALSSSVIDLDSDNVFTASASF